MDRKSIIDCFVATESVSCMKHINFAAVAAARATAAAAAACAVMVCTCSHGRTQN